MKKAILKAFAIFTGNMCARVPSTRGHATTVDSLISGHHWGKDYCPLIRGVHLLESL